MQIIPMFARKPSGERDFITIIHRLDDIAADRPADKAFRFYPDDPGPIDESRSDGWTWGELNDRVKIVSDEVSRTGLVGQGGRVLIVYPPGLAFIAAFLGCLHAGAVPVPVPAPRRNEGIHRWLHIAKDAGISGIVCAAELKELLEPLQRAVGHGFCLAPSGADPNTPLQDLTPSSSLPAVLDGSRIAFLQYTSGSTSDPKGVMVTHANLMANLRQISLAFHYGPEDRSATWLPHYHDMGLIDGILSPIFNGFPVSIMAPASFLRRPLRFLELATQNRATIIGGPNFAYEHCADRYSAEAAAPLDLSTVRIAYNGAEPVRPHTLRRFSALFADHGFRHEAFYCCYGQAEATLFLTGNAPSDPPQLRSFKRETLAKQGTALPLPDAADEHDAIELAACGRPGTDIEIVVMEPEENRLLDDGQVGELWIRGPNVTPGYWARAKASAESFDQKIAGEGGWRRTGDLGFRHDGQYFITGRLKDLIIIRGQNHHPEDIEQTAFSSHAALAQGRAGAFALDVDGEEQVGLVCELTRDGLRNLDAEAVLHAIRGAISRVHKLKLATIVLIRPSSLPRTPSGKVRRFACRQDMLNGNLKVVERWEATPQASFTPVADPGAVVDWAQQLSRVDRSRHPALLRQWIREEVSWLSRLPAGTLPAVNAGFFDLGLDSVALVGLAGTLERELGIRMQPTLFFEHATIDALVEHLCSDLLAPEVTAQAQETPAQNSRSDDAGEESDLSSELAALSSLLQAGTGRK